MMPISFVARALIQSLVGFFGVGRHLAFHADQRESQHRLGMTNYLHFHGRLPVQTMKEMSKP